MFRIILLSAYRSLIKNRNISIINLMGLVLGIASFLFTIHYLLFEFSYDKFIPNYENVYRVNIQNAKVPFRRLGVIYNLDK